MDDRATGAGCEEKVKESGASSASKVEILMAKKLVVLGVLWSVAAILLPTPILADQSPAVTQAIAKIVEDRDRTAEYVLEIKRKYKADDADYQQARDLYVTALSKHNAWIITLKTVIQ